MGVFFLSVFSILLVLQLDSQIHISATLIMTPLYFSIISFSLLIFSVSVLIPLERKTYIAISIIFFTVLFSFLLLLNLVLEDIIITKFKWVFAFIPIFFFDAGFVIHNVFSSNSLKLESGALISFFVSHVAVPLYLQGIWPLWPSLITPGLIVLTLQIVFALFFFKS